MERGRKSVERNNDQNVPKCDEKRQPTDPKKLVSLQQARNMKKTAPEHLVDTRWKPKRSGETSVKGYKLSVIG